jgi:Fe2+ transport system protein FeoA
VKGTVPTSDEEALLSELPIGATGTVLRVGGARGVARRLMEMGLLPGTRVRIVRLAPLGDPLELRLRSYSLSLRRAEAASIAIGDVLLPAADASAAALAPEPGQ